MSAIAVYWLVVPIKVRITHITADGSKLLCCLLNFLGKMLLYCSHQKWIIFQSAASNHCTYVVVFFFPQPEEKMKFDSIFDSLGPVGGILTGDKVKPVLLNSKLPVDILGRVWWRHFSFICWHTDYLLSCMQSDKTKVKSYAFKNNRRCK